ncbi:hypothetical protein SS50377_20007 [Spironucleus salmonicida]|uniref:Uncharacterized protein n=1 Tax=Spironucleus salmonicida TaxID=348837 RepID=V6LHS9_9EUKA|nr:hypothetical protein SS50377_20004 [Spironucleus salmonicida]KAH0576661.1 hypothetical protein SS50377_20007 [Spironucleus salmonicida]|eukprot:EST43858.1 Hypothetical protein SS50377_16367 [Spironucleus salmonicida]
MICVSFAAMNRSINQRISILSPTPPRRLNNLPFSYSVKIIVTKHVYINEIYANQRLYTKQSINSILVHPLVAACECQPLGLRSLIYENAVNHECDPKYFILSTSVHIAPSIQTHTIFNPLDLISITYNQNTVHCQQLRQKVFRLSSQMCTEVSFQLNIVVNSAKISINIFTTVLQLRMLVKSLILIHNSRTPHGSREYKILVNNLYRNLELDIVTLENTMLMVTFSTALRNDLVKTYLPLRYPFRYLILAKHAITICRHYNNYILVRQEINDSIFQFKHIINPAYTCQWY